MIDHLLKLIYEKSKEYKTDSDLESKSCYINEQLRKEESLEV